MRTGSDLPEDSQDKPQQRSVVGLPAQRERVIKILSDCFARNVLELEEFERRVALVHQAGSVQELARLIEDVPAEVAEAPLRAESRAPLSRAPVLQDDEQPVYGIMMSRRFRGHWLKCRTLNTRTLMSSLEFDFRDMELPPEIVEINIMAMMSSIVVTVPRDLPVQLEVVPILGDVKEGREVKTGLPKSGPGVRISGVIVMSDIKVRVR